MNIYQKNQNLGVEILLNVSISRVGIGWVGLNRGKLDFFMINIILQRIIIYREYFLVVNKQRGLEENLFLVREVWFVFLYILDVIQK